MGYQLIEHKSAPASNMFDFTGLSLGGFQAVELRLSGLVVGTDGAFVLLRLSTGGTLRSSGYRWRQYNISTGGGSDNDNSASDTSIQLMGSTDGNYGVGNASPESGSMDIRIANVDATALYKHVIYNGVAIGPTGSGLRYSGGGVLEFTGNVDGVRILVSTGTLTAGKATLYGLRTS